jgi:hypothetical protein
MSKLKPVKSVLTPSDCEFVSEFLQTYTLSMDELARGKEMKAYLARLEKVADKLQKEAFIIQHNQELAKA